MNDDQALDLDPELRQRWEVILRKLEASAELLLSQGGLVSKVTASGRLATAIRWVDRSRKKPVHHSIFLGDDERLVDLVRRQLENYRMLGRLPEEISGHARFAASASFMLRRLATGRRRGLPRA